MITMRVPGYRRCDRPRRSQNTTPRAKSSYRTAPTTSLSLYQCSNHLSNCAGGLAAVRAGGVGIQARGDSQDCAGGLGRERALWGAEYWRRSGAPPARLADEQASMSGSNFS